MTDTLRRVGDRLEVFDPKIWGGRDRGDNAHCWKMATVLEVTEHGGEPTYTVKFDHDGRVSRGHFAHATRGR